jgi:hypothetical protein
MSISSDEDSFLILFSISVKEFIFICPKPQEAEVASCYVGEEMQIL